MRRVESHGAPWIVVVGRRRVPLAPVLVAVAAAILTSASLLLLLLLLLRWWGSLVIPGPSIV